MTVADAVGRALVGAGIDTVFGVVGSGNFVVTNAMVGAGARYVAARHEGGAATMADAYARMSGRPAAVTVHQGCGLTNALTGITEAAKSRTPLVVVAAEATQPRSNFYVDQAALAAGGRRGADARGLRRRRGRPGGRRGSHRGAGPARGPAQPAAGRPAAGGGAGGGGSTRVAVRSAGRRRRRPAAGRRPAHRAPAGVRGRPRFPGAGSRAALEDLAARTGALLATSAVAKGLFAGSPWSLDVSGGFASPLAAELITGADLVVGWGCALNMWTMRHGRLIGRTPSSCRSISTPRRWASTATSRSASSATCARRPRRWPRPGRADGTGYRTAEVAAAIRERVRWRDVPYDDRSDGDRIDPRTLTIALDDLLPAERIVAVDSGNFMGYPSMFLEVPDEFGFCFTQAFQSIGLGLSTAIGAALARPDRLPVAALGDGGALMGASELETVVRLGLPMVVVVYDDAAYGAEVHHFGPGGHPLDTVRFPETDFAAIARGYGFEAVTARSVDDLAPVADWVAGPRSAPLLIDAKVAAGEPSWWLEEAFRGH